MKKQLLFLCVLIIAALSAHAQLNYQWAKGIGGSGNDLGKAVATDDAGNVYVTGILGLGTINFNPYGTNAITANSGGTTCFYAKYTPDGTCVWAKTFATPNLAVAFGFTIQVRHDGSRVYIGGSFLGQVDFDSPNNIQLTSNTTGGSNLDAFVAEYNGVDGSINWVKPISGTGSDFGTSLTVDEAQNIVYLTGNFEQSADFDPMGVSTVIPSKGSTDIYVAAFNTLTGNFISVKTVGGAGADAANTISLDQFGNYCIAGTFNDSVSFAPAVGVDTIISLGHSDIFFAKYDNVGNCLWAKQIGSLASDGAMAMVTDTANNIYLTGYFGGGADFDPDTAFAAQQKITAQGLSDIFFAKYTSSGTYMWVKQIACATQSDSIGAASIAVNKDGKIFLTGFIKGSANFDQYGLEVLASTTVDSQDVFLAKFESDGSYGWAKACGSNGGDYGAGVAADTLGNCFFVGGFSNSVNFDFNSGSAMRQCNGYFDIFIAKYGYGNSMISGRVLNNGGGVYGTNNRVLLYTQVPNDGNQAMHLVDETTANSGTGNYSFFNVVPGHYLVLAIPDTIDYGSSLGATYFGDTVGWTGADTLNVMYGINNNNIDINLVSISALTGTATLSGFVIEGQGFDRTPGTPIQGTPIGLDHDPGGNMVAHATTDNYGYYEFKHVPSGDYTIYVNIPGLPMDTYHVNVAASDSVAHLDFVADSNSVDTVAMITSAVNNLKLNRYNMFVFPNPSKGTSTIEFSVLETSFVQLEIKNILGDKVQTLINEVKQPGVVKYQFNAIDKGLPAGVYFVNLRLGSNTITQKIILTE